VTTRAGSVGSRETDVHRSRSTGQSLVEFALVLPLFLVILIGMVDVGRSIWANNSVANAAREAARYAIVHGGTRSNPCPVGPPITTGPTSQQTIIPPASASCPYPSPSKEGIKEAARAYAIAAGFPVTVQVCYGSDCTGDTDITGATNARGTPVTVTVSGQVPMIVPRLVGITQINVDATSTMLVSH
jgi:Flp pilus assembly protein TadG